MNNERITNGRIIRIHQGEVNKPIIEDIKDEEFMKTAIFGMQYEQMLSLLDKYVAYRKSPKSSVCDVESPNNVFSFVGERGSGKTSCMSSISRLLTTDRICNFTSYKNLSQASFERIDIIDPSYFDEKHNIVAMMVAKLYKSFCSLEQVDSHENCNFDIHNDLIDAFAKTQRSLRCLLDETDVDEYDDDLEHLSDLSIAVDLRNDIQNLVQTYLRFVKKENGFLILSIDDIDLNVGEADTMAEQIRKYLVSPHIVILLAAKLDQLATIKNLHYAEKYKYLIDGQRLSYDVVEEMTGQFLTKFAPHDQRVYMPSSEFYLESGIEIDGNQMYGDSVKQVIPELVFNRTRYLFYNTKQTASFIVPRNLRKMCQLVAMLWSMDTYNDTVGIANKQVFRNYLFGSWMQDNLSQKDRRFVQRVLDGWRYEQLNKVTLDVLREKYIDWMERIVKDDSIATEYGDLKDEVKSIFDDKNREFNFSVGDVMSLINVLQVSYESQEDKCFFFILKSIYSIALYESYDYITEEQDQEGYDEFKENVKENAKAKDDGQVLLYDPFSDEHVSAYHKLVGGRFFNYRLDPVFSKESISTKLDGLLSRSDRKIDYNELRQLISKAIEEWKTYNGKDKLNRLGEKEPLGRKIRLAEFFMLCSIRDISMKNAKDRIDYYEPTFRQSDSVYYNGEYTGKSWLYFDLGAFFYNVTCMRMCYLRFGDLGKELLDLCKSDEDSISLFSLFRQEAKEYRKGLCLPHAWQSWASIRNSEILSDLNQQLRSKCRRMKRPNNRLFLRSYFDVVGNYNIKTYDRNEKGTQLTINFKFASEISELLGDDNLQNTFERIYAGQNNKEEQIEGKKYVDIKALLKGRFKEHNKKDTVLKYLSVHEPYVYENHRAMLDAAFFKYGESMTKKEIEEAAIHLNILLQK